jgi:hypothetical protein
LDVLEGVLFDIGYRVLLMQTAQADPLRAVLLPPLLLLAAVLRWTS